MQYRIFGATKYGEILDIDIIEYIGSFDNAISNIKATHGVDQISYDTAIKVEAFDVGFCPGPLHTPLEGDSVLVAGEGYFPGPRPPRAHTA